MKKILIGIVVGLILGVAISASVYIVVDWENWADCSKRYGSPELIYSFQSLGVVATFSAVVVAIFGNEIKNIILSGKCVVIPIYEGFLENLGETEGTENPQSQVYECPIKITNTGSRELMDCELKLLSLEYKDDSSKSQFNKVKLGNPRTIYWSNYNDKRFNLREGDSLTKILARIYPNNESATPDGTEKSRMRFSITGGSDKIANRDKKGSWRAIYAIQTPQKTIAKFEMVYSWNGQWFSRMSEMNSNNNSTVSFKKL